jgi:serine/threonine protein kinase
MGDRLQRFAQECRAAAALNHPNILSIFDVGEDRGAPYVVSELLEGETLRDRLRGGPSRMPTPWGAMLSDLYVADGLK